MAKKKKNLLERGPRSKPDKDSDEATQLADCKEFKINSKKKKEDWLTMADASWREVKKRNRNGRPAGG